MHKENRRQKRRIDLKYRDHQLEFFKVDSPKRYKCKAMNFSEEGIALEIPLSQKIEFLADEIVYIDLNRWDVREGPTVARVVRILKKEDGLFVALTWISKLNCFSKVSHNSIREDFATGSSPVPMTKIA